MCRTAGFWGNRGNGGVTDEVLDLMGGSMQVCGQTITRTTPIGGLGSALEAECVSVEGVKQRQLYRQLVAARLNCGLSYMENCDELVPNYSTCDQICAHGAAPGQMNKCIRQLDCFNNGGEMINGKCALGTCKLSGAFCGDAYGKC